MTDELKSSFSGSVGQDLDRMAHIYTEAVDRLRELYKVTKRTEAALNELGNPVAESIAVYARVYTIYEKISDIVKEFGTIKDLFNKSLLPQTMTDHNTNTLTISEGHRATITEKVYAAVKAGQRENAYKWLKENGADSLVTETVNAQTLSAYAKSLAEENMVLPDEYFNVSVIPSVSLTRAKGWSME